MKRITIAALIGLLVAADAGLIVAYLRRDAAAHVAQQSPQSGSRSEMPAGNLASPQSKLELDSTLWEQLRADGDDSRTFATKLRKAGVPDRMARVLVSEVLHEEYLAKQRELVGSSDLATFWSNAAAAADRDKQLALRKLAREHQDLLTQLYGSGDMAALNRERLARLYGPLADEKLERIDRIHADYGDMADDIRAQSGGLLLATDRETLALLEQERRKDVAAILTSEELERYDLLNSTTARALRARLATFAPTDAEFRALFRLQRDFDERFGSSVGAPDDARQRERSTAEAELESRIRTALGDARYAEYRLQQEPSYRIAARIAERYGLPAKRAGEVQALTKSAQAKLQALRDDTTLAPIAAREALAKLGRETDDRLVALLGGDGAELYRQTSCGAWLRALERATAEPSATGEGPSVSPVPPAQLPAATPSSSASAPTS